jgi:glucose-1-phosphate thymidylyltransferase
MRGIVLAGGTGSRLWPITKVVSKQLLPVYDKPMVYYPISTLMLAGIRDILIISTPTELPRFQELLGDGARWGVNFSYEPQPGPASLVLGDNIFYGQGLSKMLQRTAARTSGATVFAYYVKDPQRYGVVDFDDQGRALSIEEKPKAPKSNFAVTGLYFYDAQILDVVQNMRPSARGELEITDVNKEYLRRGALQVEQLGRGFAWLDTGTPESLLQAAQYVELLEQRQGLRIGVPEEIAFRMGFLDAAGLGRAAAELKGSDYGNYLAHILEESATTRGP